MQPVTNQSHPTQRDQAHAIRDVLDNVQSLGITARYQATMLYNAFLDDEDWRDSCRALRAACQEILRITEPLEMER